MSGTPTPSDAPLGALGALGRAWRATMDHKGVALFAVAFVAALNVPLHFVGDAMDFSPSVAQSQAALVKLILGQFAVVLVLDTLTGPLFGALAVYVGRRFTLGETGDLYRGLNFAISRYVRILGWYAVVQLCVQGGLQIIVLPGILFFQMYAFVVPILCLEKEKWPLARSKRLTAGRRRAIFLLFLPSVLLEMGFGLLDFLGKVKEWVTAALGSAPQNALAVTWFGIECSRLFYEFLMVAALYFLYEDRVSRLRPAKPAAE